MSKYVTRGAWASTSTGVIFVPFIEVNETVGAMNRQTVFVTPIGGTLTFRCRLSADASGGSTILGVHRNLNTTPETTDTQTVGAGPQGAEFSLSSAGWVKGDKIGFSVDPTTSLSVGYLTVVWND